MRCTKQDKHEASYRQWRTPAICLFLIVSTLMVYWQVKSYEFINLDDDVYVTKNPFVPKGITAENILRAFSPSTYGNYWHPLTCLSHMLDCEMFGLNAGMHHMTSVFIHILNALLLFWVLSLMTGAPWKSAFVAALFALHPLNVDSVAWIADRKNVLSTLFWLLTMLSYVYYAKKPGVYRYILIVICFSLGLLAKPMLVTLPCALILLDFWPLKRFKKGIFALDLSNSLKFTTASSSRLFLEKIPLLFLSIVMVYISVSILQNRSLMITTDVVPMGLRLKNALISYILYFYKTVYPQNLSVFYTFPKAIPTWQAIAAGISLVCATALMICSARKYPFLIVGWFWYLGTLVPVIGIVQNGLWPALADRWAYIPLIGIFIIFAWGGEKIINRLHMLHTISGTIPAVILILLMLITWKQTGYWQNSITLFEHALEVNPDNEVAQYNLSTALSDKGMTASSLKHLKEALRINPRNIRALNNMGNIFARQDKLDEAIACYKKALNINSSHIEARNNLANALISQGKISAGISQYLKILKINPRFAEAHANLGLAYAGLRQYDKAIAHFKAALKIKPDDKKILGNLKKVKQLKDRSERTYNELLETIRLTPNDPEPHYRLGVLYQRQNQLDQAFNQYQTVLSLDPGFTDAMYNMAIIYALRNEYSRSLSWFNKVLQLKPDNSAVCYNISCIYARQHKKEEAVLWLKKAINLGYDNWEQIKTDNDLDNIRDTAYYQQLLGKK